MRVVQVFIYCSYTIITLGSILSTYFRRLFRFRPGKYTYPFAPISASLNLFSKIKLKGSESLNGLYEWMVRERKRTWHRKYFFNLILWIVSRERIFFRTLNFRFRKVNPSRWCRLSLIYLFFFSFVPVCTRFSNGVASMLGAVSSNAFDTLYSYSNTFHVPFVTPWFPEKVLNATSDDYAISLWPDYHKAIIDVIVYYGWSQVIYIYDSHDGK